MKSLDVYRNLILRAVADEDPTLLTIIVTHFADTEQAKRLLIQKGYGQAGTSMTDMVKAVPNK